MYPCDGAEFVQKQAVHAPLLGHNATKLVIKLLHFALDEPKTALSIFEHCVLRSAILLLILLEDDLVNGLREFPPVVFPQYLNDR